MVLLLRQRRIVSEGFCSSGCRMRLGGCVFMRFTMYLSVCVCVYECALCMDECDSIYACPTASSLFLPARARSHRSAI